MPFNNWAQSGSEDEEVAAADCPMIDDTVSSPVITIASSGSSGDNLAMVAAPCPATVDITGDDDNNDSDSSNDDVWRKRRAAKVPVKSKGRGAAAAKSKPSTSRTTTTSTQKALIEAGKAVCAAILEAGGEASAKPVTPPPQQGANNSPHPAATDTVHEPPRRASGVLGQQPASPSPGSGVLVAQASPGKDGGIEEEEEEEDLGATDEDAADLEKTRAARGTAGTFGGRRPPKCPLKLKAFNKKKEAHLKAKAQQKKAKIAGEPSVKVPSLRQKAYWKDLSDHMKSQGKPAPMKRPAAAITPQKKKPAEEGDIPTPDKAQAPSQKQREKASGSSGSKKPMLCID